MADKLRGLMAVGLERLEREDPELFELLERELERQSNVLAMVAASSIAEPSILVCEGMPTTNVTTEGYPGRRYHGGCAVVDEIERLAIERAKQAFGARYANVQPHSGSSANAVVLFSLLRPGDTLLGLELSAGGHLTHGAKPSVTGQVFRAIGYGVDAEGRLDYQQIARLAGEQRPKLIVCGASAYPRQIDFARFRAIADQVGAYLLADISHIAGLVAAGVHPSPIDHAHITTTSTYKQLYGPRGGLILSGRDAASALDDGVTLAERMQRAVFPFFQGTPNLSAIAAKARALARVASPEFRRLAGRIVADARALAQALAGRGARVLSGGTDTHMVLIDVGRRGLTGTIAERALEECGIVVNKNRIPGDPHPPQITSGLRLGTNALALRGLGPEQMEECAELVDQVLGGLRAHDLRRYALDPEVRDAVRRRVAALCRRFPIPDYPEAT
jgi:glycine hydroxymethyltransferase